MIYRNNLIKVLLYCFLWLISLNIVFSPTTFAQYWSPLPPYNTLWPLWAPALSPVDPVTGFPTPIVSNLFPNTVLPVQPGLTWDPALSYPWLLYNTPLGLTYYDPLTGIDHWPPSYLVDSLGPLPIFLPPDYASLGPTDSSWLTTNFPIANTAFTAYLKPLVLPPTTLPPLVTPPTATPPLSPAPWSPPIFLGLSGFIPPVIIPPPLPIVVPTVIAPTTIAPTVIIIPATTVVPASVSGLFPFPVFPFL